MTTLPGYLLEPLSQDGELAFLRAVPERDEPTSPRLLVLTPAAEWPGSASIARLEHIWALRDQLDPVWAARPRALEHRHGRPLLLLDDPGGELLSQLLSPPLELTALLRIAIGIAVAIGRLHRQGLVHRDVKPCNILVHAATGRVWLAGLSTASPLPRARKGLESPEPISGTLAYMAPEQTGRMNRSVDSRSDLYSVGITLYELLTGSLPFSASDLVGWVHCHVAREPAEPTQRPNGEKIPAVLGGVVLKLLAKAAEDRYQTATGLELDLRRCLAEWELHTKIDSFPLGACDVSDRLLQPGGLFGREQEIGTLRAAFERVLDTGKPELLFVSGYSGVGKSALVSELRNLSVTTHALFAIGKCDEFKRDVPYTTLAQAFQSVVGEILSRSDAEVGWWRDALREALGSSGQLMVNLVPELELIVGGQQALPDLPARDAQNRFQLVFRRFIGVVARPEHPLVLFLDDLQWLDLATFNLVEWLVTGPEVGSLLLIGAYRDNEVHAAHPLQRKLELLRGSEASICELVLEPLARQDVSRLIQETLRCNQEHAEPLTGLIYQKTAGNPFFAIQLIGVLAEEGLLVLDPGLAMWTWDLPRIRAKGFSDNVADLMVAKLSRLPLETRTALARLACLGSVGETATLALVLGQRDDLIHEQLREALRLGLIFSEGGQYGFLHDRVYEAAYSLIPEQERAAEHLKIARLLTPETTAAESEQIFAVVNHFNRAAALLEHRDERERVASLNLMAGKRAKASTAHASALNYCTVGRALLDEASWTTQYDLTFGLELHIAECAFLTGDLPAAQERLAVLAARAEDTVDRAAVTRLQMALYTTLGRTDRALETGLGFLGQVGFDWSPHSTDEKVSAELERMRQLIAGRAIEELIDLPLMSDPDCLATVDVLAEFLAPASFAHRGLFDLALLRTTNLSLAHGNCAASPFAYALLNIVLGLDHGDYQTALRFGQLGCDLVDKRGLDRFKARVYNSFATFVLPWTRHLPLSRPILRRALDATTATGDLTFEAYTRRSLVSNMMVSGERLENVQRETEQALAFARKAKFGFAADSFVALLILIRDVRGSTEDDGLSGEPGQDESAFERHLTEGGPRLAVAASRYWIGKIQARFFAGDYAGAIAAATQASDLLWASRPFVEIIEYHFYAALSLAGAYDSAAGEQRLQYLATINSHRELIASRAQGCPENWDHRAALIAAEVARLEERDMDAMRLYEKAILSAKEHGFAQNEGICSELAAKFCEARQIRMAAYSYWRNARSCYERWGAVGKVRRLDELHLQPHEGAAITAPAVTSNMGQIDVSAMVKMSQAVSGEIVLDRLIEKLMVIAVEHAGAVRGVLRLQQGTELKIEAEGTTSRDGVKVYLRQMTERSAELPESILRYVIRSQDSVIMDDALLQNPFSSDEYIRRRHPRSILCLPLVKQASLIGALYLENNLSPNVFTPARTTVLQVLASQAAISLENARLYAELQNSDAYLAEAQRLSHTGSFGWNVDTGELHWSDETFQIYGFDGRLKPTIDLLAQRTHPDDRAGATQHLKSAVLRALDWELEYRLLMPDGSIKNLRLVARAVRESEKQLAYVGAVMDVTAAKRAEQSLQTSLSEKHALLKEVHHRVKNNLQLLSSLLNLQAGRTKDHAVAELFADSRNRVRSMALVHENLYRAGDFGKVAMAPHIQNLCAHLTRVYAVCDRPIDLIVQIGECNMDLDRAVSCGLLVNELVSNALKHAFPDGRRGHVWVELRSSPGGLHELVVSDDGVGLAPDVAATRGESLGLQLVGDLTKQLGGSISVDRASGTKFSIAFGPVNPATGVS